MSNSMPFLFIGIAGIILNTIGLISFYIKMKKENERAFVTFRGLDEPNTSYYVAHQTITISSSKPKIFERNTEDLGTMEETDWDIDDTVPF